MTRLESGAIEPNASLLDVGEVVGSVLQRGSKILAEHRVEVETAADLPMVNLDAVLFEQVLFNLLDNAAKYAPPGSTIRLQSWRDQRWIHMQVLDEEAGIPEDDLERILGSSIASGRATLGAPVRA